MHFIKTITTSLSLVSIAWCSEIDIHARQSPNERVVQIVTVSDTSGALKFFPEQVVADVGSVIQFQFYPKNHTITESSFAAPCVPIAANLTTPERPGQKSGFVPVGNDTQFRPIYNLLVNDTKPMWIYCGQAPHCQKGMAMVINQNMTDPNKTLEKYKVAAAALPVPNAPAPSASSASSAPGATTVVPAGSTTTAAPAGPSLGGSTTTAAASGTGIGPFTGGASVPTQVPAGVMLGLAAGVLGLVVI